jgi:CBS domain containing-hemolysin-like protein
LPGLNGADVDTVSGYVIQQLGRWPRPGDRVALGENYNARVTAVQQKRVAQVLISPKTQEAARQDGPGEA